MTINFSLVLHQNLNPLKIHPEKITKTDKEMVNDLDYADIKFPVSNKDYSKIQQKNNICIFSFIFSHENGLVYSVHVSDKKVEDYTDLLLITDENKSHYVYIKILTDLCVIRQEIRIKNTFADTVYSVLEQ